MQRQEQTLNEKIITAKLTEKLNISDGSSTGSSGGDQAWFDSPLLRDKGCGIVSAANISAYLGLFGGKKYESLFGSGVADRKRFIKVMTEMAGYIRPGHIFGVLPRNYIRGIRAYAETKGVKLSEHVFNMKKGPEAMKSFIRDALEKDRPVGMLIGYNPKLKEIVLDHDRSKNSFLFHWVTVTELTHCREDDTDKVRVLSWGDCAEIDLDVFYRTFYKTLVYFD